MVGISLAISFSARLQRGARSSVLALHALRRSALLVILGLLVNGFPFYRFATIRIPGILQRIGVCYLCVSLLYLCLSRPSIGRRTRRLMLLSICVAVLMLYWLLLIFYPTPAFGAGHLDPLGNLASVLDRAIFTQAHMFQWGIKTPGVCITFDPEGLLSTLGAIGTTLIGVLAGDVLCNRQIRRRQCVAIATAGSALWLISLVLRHWMPINKQIYTPTFALWSAGLSLIGFAGLFWLIDAVRFRRGWTFALILGTNAIFAFLVSQIITTTFSLYRVTSESNHPLYVVLDTHLFATWLPPRPASVAWALCIVMLNAAILYPLYRKRIFVRL